MDQHRELWPVERFGYAYRSSILKSRWADSSNSAVRPAPEIVILAARLLLEQSRREAVLAKQERLNEMRRLAQPPGASMGSMFKNPPGDFAGRLIEAAGLKGVRRGGAEISQQHGNFFINTGSATAADILALIAMAKEKVADEFGVELELEIEVVGEPAQNQNQQTGW